jgi:hypothetical protein
MSRGRVDARKCKAGFHKYPVKFALTALNTTSDGEHQEVHELAVVWCITIGQHGLDDEQAALGRQRLTAFAQDGDRVVIAPVVQHMRQHVYIVPGRDTVEKIAGLKPTALSESRLYDVIARMLRSA